MLKSFIYYATHVAFFLLAASFVFVAAEYTPVPYLVFGWVVGSYCVMNIKPLITKFLEQAGITP
jgi:hypothetical protein